MPINKIKVEKEKDDSTHKLDSLVFVPLLALGKKVYDISLRKVRSKI